MEALGILKLQNTTAQSSNQLELSSDQGIILAETKDFCFKIKMEH